MDEEKKLKSRIISKVRELQDLLDSCNDDDFVDSVITAIKYNSYIEDDDTEDENSYYDDPDYDSEEDSYDFDYSLGYDDEEDREDEGF